MKRISLHKTVQAAALLALLTLGAATNGSAQELNAKVNINFQKIESPQQNVFDALKEKTQQFLNEHTFTTMQFRPNERINCSFNITVDEYKADENSFKCTLLMTAQRPVYNSSYTTTSYSVQDKDFDFQFQATDQLEFRSSDQMDNHLVALLVYYAYMIIGYDLDTFSPLGGTSYFQQAEDIVNGAESMGYTGWKAFGDSGNRFGLLNDYLDGSMESYRQLQYNYHRLGLDQMADNVEEGRNAIKEALNLLDEARQAKSMSHLPQLFTEYKHEELVNIWENKGTPADRKEVHDILFNIDPSQSNTWDRIK